jgi:hypothetical protein
MSKYDRLTQYLSRKAHEKHSSLRMSFAEVGALIPGGLPASALKYTAWWNSNGHSHAQSWERSGFKASPDLADKTVLWTKLGSPSPVSRSKSTNETFIQSVNQDWTGPDHQSSIYLVACVKGKLDGTHRAKDIYDSDLFRKMRAFVESRESPWLILSAKYGLVPPEQQISTYDETLKFMSAAENRFWARKVLSKASRVLPDARRIVFLAGNDYRKNLIQGMSELGYSIEVPMEGLGIGRQLSWLLRHTR